LNSNKGIKNVIWGIFAQVVTIGIGIMIPRLVLVNLGSEANGLMNSINSILSYMSLLEAGVGTATLQALYTPFSKDDHNSINRIMSATHFFYKRTGYIYLAIVMLLSISYVFVVETSLPKIYVFLVVILAGLSGVISYFFQGKYRIFLSAEGKGYITTNIATISNVGVSLLKALLLVNGANVVMIQMVYFIFNFFQMLFIVIYMHKCYRWLDLKVKPDFEAISQKKAVMVHQIAELIFNNTDMVILTIFTTLKTVSVYSMYAMIFGMVKSVTVTLSDGFLYALGQSYHDKKRFLRMHDAYEVYNMAVTFAMFCIAGILILPFLRLYTKGVSDINYIDSYVALLFMLFYLLSNGRKSSQIVINFAQHFEKTKWRAVAESVINLTVSILLTKKCGIYGVLLGTIVALLYRTNDVIIYAAKLMKRSAIITYKRWLVDFLLFVVIYCGVTKLNLDFSSYLSIFINGSILSIIIIFVFVVVNSVLELDTAKYVFCILKNGFRRKSENEK